MTQTARLDIRNYIDKSVPSISPFHQIFLHTLYKFNIWSALLIHEYILTTAPEIEGFWSKQLQSFLIPVDNHSPESRPRKDNRVSTI